MLGLANFVFVNLFRSLVAEIKILHREFYILYILLLCICCVKFPEIPPSPAFNNVHIY